MKITAFILLAFCLHVSATTLAQNVTLSEHKASLEKVFNDIHRQSGYNFFYNKEWMRQARPVDLSVKDMSLAEALKICFEDQPFTYEIVDKTIVLKIKEKPAESPNVPVQAVTVTGKVTDELGNAMAGVTVKQKDNPANGTVTDAKGNYTLSVPNDKTVLVFSFIGYDPQELAAKDIPAGSVITLKVAENNLHEVVINKGYYTEKQEVSTGDVSVVSAKTIQEQPVSDPIQALIGRVAGLNIQQTSGVPGSYATIRINGLNSIANGNDPFYVVDGVPFSAVSLTNNNFQGGALFYGSPNFNNGGGLSPFNALNPDDIESIEVLKDADATAIYGSRGANGVILITTKKGKAGETKVSVDLSQGIGQVGHFMDMLNTQQYLQMRHTAYANDGITAIPSNAYDINGEWDTTRYTNWQKALIGGTAHYSNAQASISGGNANTQFVVNGGYYRAGTVYPGNFDDKKSSLHFSLTNTSSNQKFKAVLTAGYVNENNNLPQIDFANYITLAPDAPAVYNPNGSLNWQMLNGTSTFSNPLAQTLQTTDMTTNNLMSSLNLSYQMLPGLVLSGNFGYSHDEMNQTNLYPASAVAPPNNTNPNYRAGIAINSFTSGWIIEPKLSYSRKIGKGELNALLGGTVEQNISQDIANEAYGFTSDALLTDLAAAPSYLALLDAYSLYRYEALVARIGFTWENKYLLNLTANRDGSSRFGPGKQYGNFASVGAGWIFSKEKAVQDIVPWLSFGKIRLSYGTTGNDQIGDYQYLSTYTAKSISYQGDSEFNPTRLPNASYSWEVDKKLEGGLDLGLFRDRISLSLSYYKERSGNQLVGYPLPSLTGFTSVQYNLPAVVQNTSVQAELHTVNIKTSDFNWTTSVNFTLPNNKLVSFPGLAGSSYANIYVVGQSLFIKKVYDYTGVNPQTGLYTFKTPNANGIPSSPLDKIASPPITQKYYGGVGNDFTYKSFSLDIFIQFVSQLGLATPEFFSSPGSVNANEPTSVLGAWAIPGQAATVQRYGTTATPNASYSNFAFQSTATYTNTSFIRIKNVALNYRLPANWQKWAHMQNAKIYIQGQNLYTFTHYTGLDPEESAVTTLPPLRVIMAGVSASF